VIDTIGGWAESEIGRDPHIFFSESLDCAVRRGAHRSKLPIHKITEVGLETLLLSLIRSSDHQQRSRRHLKKGILKHAEDHRPLTGGVMTRSRPRRVAASEQSILGHSRSTFIHHASFQIRRQHNFDPFHECADSARQIAPMCYDEGHGERPATKIGYNLHKRSTL
jgi:hypothetical protein